MSQYFGICQHVGSVSSLVKVAVSILLQLVNNQLLLRSVQVLTVLVSCVSTSVNVCGSDTFCRLRTSLINSASRNPLSSTPKTPHAPILLLETYEVVMYLIQNGREQ